MNRFDQALNVVPAPIAGTVIGELDELATRDLFEIADIAELRADKLTQHSESYLREQVQKLGELAVLFTLRMSEEGGGWQQPEADRLPLLRAIADSVDAFDIELASTISPDVISLAHNLGKPAVVSIHNF